MKKLLQPLVLALFLVFALSACYEEREKEPCETVFCLPNQYCVDGQCIYKPGFQTVQQIDSNKKPIPPSQIWLHKIELTKFPERTIDNKLWDANSNPDLYLTLYQSSNQLWTIPQVITDAPLDSVLVLDLVDSLEIKNFDLLHTLSVYDHDSLLTDQFMGGALFKPYNSNMGSPKILEINTGGVVAFRLHLTYN